MFLNSFGPVSQKTYNNFWSFTTKLMDSEWFHGVVSGHQARDRLRNGKVNNNDYLLRVNTYDKSEERDEPFVLCYRMTVKDKTKNFELGFRVKYDTDTAPETYIATIFKEKGIEKLAPCSYDRSKSFEDVKKASVTKKASFEQAHNVNAAGSYFADASIMALAHLDLDNNQ